MPKQAKRRRNQTFERHRPRPNLSPNAFTTEPPEPPPHLNADAKSKWRGTWPRLDRNFRDRYALGQYCDAWAAIRQADREIKQQEQLRKLKTGTVEPGQSSNQTRRSHEQRLAAMERFDGAAEKLGLSLYVPQSRPWSDYCSLLSGLPRELAAQDEKESAEGRRRIWTFRRVWAALQGSCGNMTAAARLLSETYGVTCTRATISRLVKKYPQLCEAIEECELVLFHICNDSIVDYALAGDRESRQFLLTMYHPAYED